LKESLNNWLSSPSMFSIEKEILHKLTDKSEEIRFVFQIEAPQSQALQQLPWHSWDIFRQPNYIKSEAGLYLPVGKSITTVKRDKVKVLAVFGKQEGIGNATKIKTEEDWGLLQKYLSAKSNAELIRLDEPTLEELCEQIEAHCPQILFFAGHSSSEENGTVGLIELNQQESITIDDLEPDLREAVEQGLQLAIFNSCEGLAIARQLANIHIPNIIVMREPVPDEVAQKFLQRFLEAFAQGQPLHLAVRKAREKINRLENKYPGATWLPVIFQNPAEPPLTWGRLGGVEISGESDGNQASVLWLPTSTVNEPDYYITKKNSSLATTQRISKVIDLSTKLQSEEPIQPNNYLRLIDNRNNQIANENQTLGKTVIGRYKFIKQLGKGGFGTTYLAVDMEKVGNMLCVVKQFKLMFTGEYVSWLFTKEAQVLQKLGQHPQIPKYFSFLEEHKKFYLVQEFVDGNDLSKELIPGEKKNEEYVNHLLTNVLEVLKFVHDEGVIHRDIKPSNLIRRNQDGKIVLIDFGSVKKIGNITAESVTQPPSALIGTPGYFAPEQAVEFSKPSSDIYSLGIVCIQALTGILPSQLAKYSETGEIDWHNEAEASPKLARILNKMVRYDFRDRYQSVEEVLQDLNRSVGTEIIHSPTCILPLPIATAEILGNYSQTLNTSASKLKIKLIVVLVAFVVGILLAIFVPKVLKRENPAPRPKGQTSLVTDY
jgi:Protein kinase domain/CHAT domain